MSLTAESLAAELLTADHSLLLLIDLQSKLAPAIHNNAEVEQHCRWLVEVARELAVPVLATEQYPQGLGVTVPSVLALLKSEEILEKIHFSAHKEPHIQAALADSGLAAQQHELGRALGSAMPAFLDDLEFPSCCPSAAHVDKFGLGVEEGS